MTQLGRQYSLKLSIQSHGTRLIAQLQFSNLVYRRLMMVLIKTDMIAIGSSNKACSIHIF